MSSPNDFVGDPETFYYKKTLDSRLRGNDSGRNMKNLDTLIDLALAEDISTGDITTLACVSEKTLATASIRSKESIVVCGIEIAQKVFQKIDPNLDFQIKSTDGTSAKAGDILATISGKARSLLSGERTALNFMQHLSGIATLTSSFIKTLNNSKTKILDTRKTIPGWRELEKYAVKIGGGTNHRIGLFDHFLIKNNHITAAGSISKALALAHSHWKPEQKIEIEVRSTEEVKEALEGNPDIIMLDNMSPSQAKETIDLISGKTKTEISGNMTLNKISDYTNLGADFISVGALTHSAKAADIHMLIEIL